MTNKKYQIIYADPAWKYDFSKKTVDSIEYHYPTMTTEEICKLKIPSDDNCVLYLWATAPKLLEAIDVMKSWGFKYKTHAIWDKGDALGLGYWFRGQHELHLVGTKGNFSPPKNTERIGSIFREKKGQHSEKPDFIKQKITEWFPHTNKLEMFCRNNKSNLFQKNDWDVWGNEVESDIEL
jgi:N6-adenosine-specific RNA methylase IME4